jgi:hypothetical protein
MGKIIDEYCKNLPEEAKEFIIKQKYSPRDVQQLAGKINSLD